MKRFVLALTIVVGAVMLVPASATAAAKTCHGLAATIVASHGNVDGTDGDDGDDVIVVVGKPHFVDAKAGDDLVCVQGTSKVPTVIGGPGSDEIDASEATRRTSASLGAGDSYLGSKYVDDVSVAGVGSTATVDTGAGSDYLSVSRGSAVDARLGRGRDGVIFRSLDGGPASTFDLGAGRDGINIEDDFDDPGAGQTTAVVDLAQGFVDWHGVRSTVRHAENAHAAALDVTMIGTADDNAFWAHGCRVDVHGKGGADSILLSSERYDQAPFIETDCPTDYDLRAYGNGGRDFLEGGWRHDVLIGGKGYDKAFGDRSGDDVCDAEVTIGAGCRGE